MHSEQTARRAPAQADIGLTLGEVLAILMVIAVLIALLLPSLSRAQDRARATQCQNNLRQIGLGLRVYLDDHGHYPRNLSWLRLDPWEVWVCPSFQPPEPRQREFYPGDYKDNAVGSGSGLPLMPHLGVLKVLGDETPPPGEPVGKRLVDLRGRLESEIVAPAEMLTVGELTRWISLFSGPPTSSDPFRWDMRQTIDYRHQGRAHFLFGDNHLEADAPAQLVGPSETVRRRWNYDHLPHDENWR